MNPLTTLLEEYRQTPDCNPVAFVCGIASLASWLAESPESSWGSRLDQMMAHVADFHRDAQPDTPPQHTGELLACPFCGEAPERDFIDDADASLELTGFHVVSCRNHNCTSLPDAHGDTPKEATENWNRRAPLIN